MNKKSETMLIPIVICSLAVPCFAASVPAATRTIETGVGPVAVALADADDDGRTDLVVATIGDHKIRVYSGGAAQESAAIGAPAGPYALLIADLDRDGDAEIAAPCYFDDRLQLVLLKRQHLEAGPVAKVKEGPIALDAADINADGLPDIVTANMSSGDVTILLQEKGLHFKTGASLPVGERPTSIAARDFDKDGRIDIAVLSSQTGILQLIRRLPGDKFNPPQSFNVGELPASMAVADFSGDGLPDIVAALGSLGGGSMLASKTDAPGTFESARNLSLPATSNAVAAGDLNGDDLIDLVFTLPSLNRVAILYAKTPGAFAPPELIEVGANPSGLALGDLDRDGRPDIACANFSGNTVTILMGSR